MSILGRTGGNSGSSSNKAFSDGFGWANLDVPTPGAAEESSRRSLGEVGPICDYSVAAKFVSKVYMTCGVLITVALARAGAKGLYVWKFPTDPNPPDLTFPAWEGPVFVMMMVGIADQSSKLMVSGCLRWAAVGTAALLCPLVVVVLGVFKIKKLTKEGSLFHMKNPTRPFSEIWSEIKSHGNLTSFTGIKRKISFIIIAVMDKRFRGNWGKKTQEAKFWGFFLGNTGILWFCFVFVLVKKIVSPLILNWSSGAFNAIAMTALFWIDGIANFITMSHRDNVINFSHLFVAVGNGLAALFTTLQIVLPEYMIPDWMNGPVVMFCMLGATAVTGLTAMAEPFSQVLSAVSSLDVLACLSPIVPILKAASGPLGKRLERIFQNRSKKKAQVQMHEEKTEKQGGVAHAIV